MKISRGSNTNRHQAYATSHHSSSAYFPPQSDAFDASISGRRLITLSPFIPRAFPGLDMSRTSLPASWGSLFKRSYNHHPTSKAKPYRKCSMRSPSDRCTPRILLTLAYVPYSEATLDATIVFYTIPILNTPLFHVDSVNGCFNIRSSTEVSAVVCFWRQAVESKF